jgi:hypothetical protein
MKHNTTAAQQFTEVRVSRSNYRQEPATGYIGFRYIDDALELAREIGGEVREFRKKDGEHHWSDEGPTYQPFSATRYVSLLGDQYNIVSEEDVLDMARERIAYDVHTLLDLISVADKLSKLAYKVHHADDSESVITRDGEFYEKVDNELMDFRVDVYWYAIGVMVSKEESDDSDDVDVDVLRENGELLETNAEGTCRLYMYKGIQYLVLQDNTVITKDEDNAHGPEEAFFPNK